MNESRVPLASFAREFVTDDAGVLRAVEALGKEDVLAVDLEMGQRVERRPGGVQEWVHILALIQLAAGNRSVVIDPLRCDPSPLGTLMMGPQLKVFLGGGQDVTLLTRAGMPPLHVVDVGEVALALFGRRQDGMAALADRIFGLSLDKTVRRTDWMFRPLNPTLLAYAHRDAELTLGIYHWLAEQYPDVVAHHTRREFDPNIPSTAPEWLRQAVSRSQQDVVAIVMEHGLNPERDAEALAAQVEPYLDPQQAPRLLNRLLRVVAELHLRSLLDRVTPLIQSPSSLLRASAARTIGQIADQQEGEELLRVLADDPIEDVRRAVASAQRELRTQRSPGASTEEEPEAPSIDSNSLSALEQLKAQLEAQQG